MVETAEEMEAMAVEAVEMAVEEDRRDELAYSQANEVLCNSTSEIDH